MLGGGGGGGKMSERTRGPIERVRAAGGNRAHGTEQPPLPRQWFSQRFAPASLRFAPHSGFPSGTSSCTSSRAPQLSREINEPATYRQPRPDLVLVNSSRKATVAARQSAAERKS